MDRQSTGLLIALGAIWGASHLFTRVAVPALGPVALIALRVLLAAALLAALARLYRQHGNPLRPTRFLLTIGVLNTALPFFLLAFAAQSLTASMLSILNATAPIWGALIGSLHARRLPPWRVGCGLALGMLGVGLVVGLDGVLSAPGSGLAVGAALAATFSYGLSSQLIRWYGKGVAPFQLAHGSMWWAAIAILPWLGVAPPRSMPGIWALLGVLVLGLLCTGVAYVMYFRLVERAGAMRALTVTFLVPVFGVLWGHAVLGEPLGPHTFAGTAVVLLGTALATGFLPGQLKKSRAGNP
ncbi:DMT family transporter [Uliginosibacterium sp. H1]|uniref:DMT family transporter n=1 Tax=Uliginosibacterium sp. H1 TaxID=3114757 RepID=UPI002E182E73|nr:DMT family transporter [Uliginosibacterium sp. H1]